MPIVILSPTNPPSEAAEDFNSNKHELKEIKLLKKIRFANGKKVPSAYENLNPALITSLGMLNMVRMVTRMQKM